MLPSPGIVPAMMSTVEEDEEMCTGGGREAAYSLSSTM